MSRQFYILRHGKKEGPLTEEEVLDSLDLGDVLPDDDCIDIKTGRARRVGDVFQIVGRSGSPPSQRPVAAISRPVAPSEPILKRPKSTPVPQPKPRKLLYFGHPSLLTYWRSFALGIAVAFGGYYGSSYTGYLGLAGWLSASLILIYILIHRSSRDYFVSPLRVEVVDGIFSKNSKEVRIEDIRAINVKTRGVTGLLGVGTVEFASAGGEAIDVAFVNVSRAHKVKQLVRRVQDKAQQNHQGASDSGLSV
ncbi:MAG: PH domain-containing protein [Verrucomicrobiales bacterium]